MEQQTSNTSKIFHFLLSLPTPADLRLLRGRWHLNEHRGRAPDRTRSIIISAPYCTGSIIIKATNSTGSIIISATHSAAIINIMALRRGALALCSFRVRSGTGVRRHDRSGLAFLLCDDCSGLTLLLRGYII